MAACIGPLHVCSLHRKSYIARQCPILFPSYELLVLIGCARKINKSPSVAQGGCRLSRVDVKTKSHVPLRNGSVTLPTSLPQPAGTSPMATPRLLAASALRATSARRREMFKAHRGLRPRVAVRIGGGLHASTSLQPSLVLVPMRTAGRLVGWQPCLGCSGRCAAQTRLRSAASATALALRWQLAAAAVAVRTTGQGAAWLQGAMPAGSG